MPQTATLPRVELVVRGDFYARLVNVYDLDSNQSSRSNLIAAAPLYLDARGNTTRGFVVLDSDGNTLASVSFDGRLSLRGIAIPVDESEEIINFVTDFTGVFFADISGGLDVKMFIDTSGNLYYKGIISFADSLTLEKATGDLTVPATKSVVCAPGALNLITTESLTYPFLQTINEAGECTSKFHADGSIELVGGYFNGIVEEDAANNNYGSIKF